MKDWKLAIVPTDTVWGLVCELDDEGSINRIYDLKNRDRSKPLILFGSNLGILKPYFASWTDQIDKLASTYWPGALTIVSKKSSLIPDFVNPGFESIGLRVPNSKPILELLKTVPGEVLLSTSANISGEPAVLNYEDACAQFENKVDLILEPAQGEEFLAQESTVIEVLEGEPRILRQGVILV